METNANNNNKNNTNDNDKNNSNITKPNTNSQFETTLIKSENFEENNQTSNALSNYLKKFSLRPDGKDTNKSSELFSLIESSSAKWNINENNHDISFGLKNLSYEAGLAESEYEYNFIRSRSHRLYTTAIAHACYFVGIANRIRRNIDDTKKGNQTIQKNSILISEMNQTPGLKVGIIGCGKLGRQLTNALLEFSKVHPNELQISTRQPETLTQFKNKKIRCFFDNGALASSSNIIFLCVLPSQLQLVIGEIKKHLPDKCIIYSFVRSESSLHIKSLLGEVPSGAFVIKAQYDINIKLDYSIFKWNYSMNIIESLNDNEVIKATNPFSTEENLLIETNQGFTTALIYGFLNICVFLGLNRKETIFCMKKYVFNSTIKNMKIDESLFFEIVDDSEIFEAIDLVNQTVEESPLSKKLKQSKTHKLSLFKNYNEYFEESTRFKNAFN